MNNLFLGILLMMAIVLCYVIYQLQQLRKQLEEIEILSINYSAYSSASIKYILITARTLMAMWMQQSVDDENYQAASEWKSAIENVDKLIKTKINI